MLVAVRAWRVVMLVAVRAWRVVMLAAVGSWRVVTLAAVGAWRVVFIFQLLYPIFPPLFPSLRGGGRQLDMTVMSLIGPFSQLY